jgi:hypothetical protein
MVSVVLAACGLRAVLAPAELDQQSKLFVPSPGKAAIYVYRLDGFRGSAGSFPVTVNGTALGRIVNGTYYMVEVEPGEHEVWVGWDQTMQKTASDPISAKLVLIPVNAVPGRTYFVRVAKTGQDHVAVPEAEGKEELLACCKRAADAPKDKELFR